MNPEEQIKKVMWYDKRLVIRSVVMGLVFFGLLYTWAMRSKPPEGFVFERVPAITGIYKCCEDGGRSTQSWVGGVQIRCQPFSYYGALGAVRNDCGLEEQLDGQPVEVVGAIIPYSGSRNLIVVRITSSGNTFYDVDDQRIRELWIDATTSSALTLAFILVVILHGAQLIYVNRNLKKPEGEKP